MRPAAVVRRATDYLARHDVESPRTTAELLLAGVLETDRTGIYSREHGLSAAEAKAFGRALCRRCTGTPTQHITGTQAFRHIVVAVRPGVFIPRPETEVLVEEVLRALEPVPSPIVVDVGTGTGAIALAVADERRDARVLATDLDPAAVALARENAARLASTIEILLGDGLDPVPASLAGHVDAVVSNPPYVERDAFDGLPAEVRADPVSALVGGLEVYAALFEDAATVLRRGGIVAVEIAETMAGAVADLAVAAGFDAPITVADLNGRDRVIVARLA